MITLYGLALSSYTAKLRIALCAKGIDFVERDPPGGYRSDAWCAIVPTGTLPAIDHDGFLLAESEAILEYLEDCFPEPSLLPGSAQDRARARQLARLHDLHLEPRVRALFPLVRDPAQRNTLPALASALDERVGMLERMTSPAHPFLAGPTLTLADCGFAVSLPLAALILKHLGRTLELPPRLLRWQQAALEHPAVAAGLAPWRVATEAWLSSAGVPS